MLDMSNATAAGPSRGLLDMLLGNKPQEEQADGQSFGNLMDLIKGLETEADSKQAGSWTDQETVTGKSAIDDPLLKNPGLYAMMNPGSQTSLTALIQQKQQEDAAAAQAVDALLAKRMEQVANSSPEMRKLFETAKALVALKNEQASLQKNMLQAMPDKNQEALNAAGAVIAKMLADRGVNTHDPDAVKKAIQEIIVSHEGSGSRQLEGMSTAAYLQMHELANGGNAKDSLKAKDADAASAGKLGKVGVKQPGAYLAAALGGADGDTAIAGPQDGKSKDDANQFIGKKEAGLSGKKSESQDLQNNFATSLDASLKGAGGGMVTKDVMLTGQHPEQIRDTITGELVHGVHMQAVKGGGEMKLVLHPPEMGEIKLKIGAKDGKVEVSASAENEQVASALRKSSQDLSNSLNDQNLTLAKFEVNVSDKEVTAKSNAQGGSMEQFLQQNSQQSAFGFSQSDRENSRWDQGQDRQSFQRRAQNEDGITSMSGASSRKRVISSNNRLDVVA